MFETLFCDEEKRLILNLNELRADYVSRRYHKNPYGKVFVTCPSGRYPLFAYLSRLAGMRKAREALDKFRAEKLTALNDEAYRTILLERENNLEDLLRRSFYYYYYANPEKIASTDDFLGAFMESVYDDEYDAFAFAEGVRVSVHATPEAWKNEQKAFAYALERMEKAEDCDAVDAAKEAVSASLVCSGTTGLSQEDLQRAIFEHATGEYYLSCIDIASNRYASPVLALPESTGSPFVTDAYFNHAYRQMSTEAAVYVVMGTTILAVNTFTELEAKRNQAFNQRKACKNLNVAINGGWRGRRHSIQDDYADAQHFSHRDYGPSFG